MSSIQKVPIHAHSVSSSKSLNKNQIDICKNILSKLLNGLYADEPAKANKPKKKGIKKREQDQIESPCDPDTPEGAFMRDEHQIKIDEDLIKANKNLEKFNGQGCQPYFGNFKDLKYYKDIDQIKEDLKKKNLEWKGPNGDKKANRKGCEDSMTYYFKISPAAAKRWEEEQATLKQVIVPMLPSQQLVPIVTVLLPEAATGVAAEEGIGALLLEVLSLIVL